MFGNKFINLFTIYLLAILLFSAILVNSNESDSDYDIEDGEEDKLSKNISLKNTNSSDENDYDVDDEDVSEECESESFIDKAKKLHEEGRAVPLTKNVKHINDTFNLLKNVRTVLGTLFGISEREKFKAYEFLSEIDFRISHPCMSSLLRIFQALSNGELWAIKLVDAMGSFPPSGFAEGVLADFGEYDECLDVRSPSTEDNQPVIKGQYCMMKVILPYPRKDAINSTDQLDEEIIIDPKFKANGLDLQKLTLKTIIETLNIVSGTIYRMGLCIPNTCSPNEVEDIINKLFQPITRLPVEIDKGSCAVKDQPLNMDFFEKLSISIFSLLIIFVVLSTFAELYKSSQKKEIPETKDDLIETPKEKLLYSFSIIRNTETLFANTNEKWQSLDTIRFLLIIYVFIAHIYLATTTLGLITLKSLFTIVIPRMFRDQTYWFARNPLMIDALYSLSGFLIAYGLLRKLDQSRGRFNYLWFVFQQWVRFTVLGFGSLLFFYIFRFSGEGPVWYYAVDYGNGCKEPWQLFRILTFLNNFYEFNFETFNQTCNLPIWFLSALMQFLLISPAFILLYWRRPKLGKYVLIAALIFTNIAAVLPYFVLGVKPYLQILVHGAKLLSSNVSDSINWYHTYPNVQAHSYFVGIAAGFVMKKGFSMSRLQVKLCWIGSVVGIVSVYVWQASFWRSGDTEPVISALLWHTVGKFIFSISFAWVLLALCSGRGYYLNRLLSWHGFRPLARLSFGIYLLHFLVVGHRIFDIKYLHVASNRVMWRFITIDLMCNVILAYVYYILIECPFGNLFRLISPQRPVGPTDEKPRLEANNNSNNRNLNAFSNSSGLTISINGNVNKMSELSKL